MLRKIVFALALALPLSVHAQVEQQFTNFVTTPTGFSLTYLWRNSNTYTDPALIEVGNRMLVETSRKVHDYCATAFDCNLGETKGVYRFGSVEHDSFSLGGPYSWQPTGGPGESGCAFKCLTRTYDNGLTVLLGCQAPKPTDNEFKYMGRTCIADGFDGWMGMDLRMTFTEPTGSSPVFDASDVIVTVALAHATGPNALFAPEPATWGMMGCGLIAVGLVQAIRSYKHSKPYANDGQ